MEIRRELSPHNPSSPGTALTIGAYDGVHVGHRQVVAEVRRLAEERRLVSAVVTFDRHPATVVRPESAPLLLTDNEQKLEQLATTGVDLTLVVPFDEVRAKEPAEEFVAKVLVGCLGANLVVVGEDFHFGHRRLGNVALLRDMGSQMGFDVLGLGLIGLTGSPARDHEQVSSTFIRRALARGDLERANTMLGRPYEVRGMIRTGDLSSDGLVYEVLVDSGVLVPAYGFYTCQFSDGSRGSWETAVSISPSTGGAGETIMVCPIDSSQYLGVGVAEDRARLTFVSRLEEPTGGDLPPWSVDHLVELAADTRRARG